jgi:hypothetical protein
LCLLLLFEWLEWLLLLLFWQPQELCTLIFPHEWLLLLARGQELCIILLPHELWLLLLWCLWLILCWLLPLQSHNFLNLSLLAINPKIKMSKIEVFIKNLVIYIYLNRNCLI